MCVKNLIQKEIVLWFIHLLSEWMMPSAMLIEKEKELLY